MLQKIDLEQQESFKLLSVSSAIVKVDSSSKIDDFDQVLSELKKESKSSKKPIYRVL